MVVMLIYCNQPHHLANAGLVVVTLSEEGKETVTINLVAQVRQVFIIVVFDGGLFVLGFPVFVSSMLLLFHLDLSLLSSRCSLCCFYFILMLFLAWTERCCFYFILMLFLDLTVCPAGHNTRRRVVSNSVQPSRRMIVLLLLT